MSHTDTFESEHLRTEIDGAVGAIVLDRPEKLNPLGTECLRDIARAARWFDDRPEVRSVVVRGEGRAFSAGADLAAFSGGTPTVDDDAPPGGPSRHFADAGRSMADAIDSMRAVTVAAIHGHCVGGGVVLAGACDIRIASQDAIFSIPEVDLGIPLAWGGIPRLVREIGPAATRDLVLTCRRFGPDEALGLDFITRVVEPGTVVDEATEIATQLAGKARYAVESTLLAVRACAEEMVGTGRAWSDADALSTALHDPEGRAAAQRYLDARRR